MSHQRGHNLVTKRIIMDRWTGGPANRRTGGSTCGPVDRWTSDVDRWTGGPADRRTGGPADWRTGGPADRRTGGPGWMRY